MEKIHPDPTGWDVEKCKLRWRVSHQQCPALMIDIETFPQFNQFSLYEAKVKKIQFAGGEQNK